MTINQVSAACTILIYQIQLHFALIFFLKNLSIKPSFPKINPHIDLSDQFKNKNNVFSLALLNILVSDDVLDE